MGCLHNTLNEHFYHTEIPTDCSSEFITAAVNFPICLFREGDSPLISGYQLA